MDTSCPLPSKLRSFRPEFAATCHICFKFATKSCLAALRFTRLMRLLSLLLLLSSAHSQTLALVHVTVVDPSETTSRSNQTIVIENGWIVDIGVKAHKPRDARIIDATGKFLIPGLWDMHTHVAGISATPQWGKTLLPQYLAYGITSIRDMAGDVDALLTWKREQQEGTLRGPRMFIAGPFLDGSTRGFDNPADVVEVTTPEAGRAAVRTLKNRGVDFIKVGSQLSRDTFFAIADECKRQKIAFLGHVPNSVSPLEASNAGMKSQEHLYGISLSIAHEEERLRDQIASARAHNDASSYAAAVSEAQATLDQQKAEQLFQAFKRNHTWVCPTLVWTEVASRLSERSDSSLLKGLPRTLQEKWSPGKALSSPDTDAYYARKLQSDLRIVGLMNKDGVGLLAGSDSLDPYVFPGDSLHRELELLVEAGLTSAEALRTATSNPAEFFGEQSELGTIAKGKRADLVLLDANPLEDIRNTRKVFAVIQNGRYMTAQEILDTTGKDANLQ